MSDTSDLIKFSELFGGDCEILRCHPLDVIEIVDNLLNPIAWVGPMVSRIEGNA